MFNKEELTLINLQYFKTINVLSDVCEVVSQNGDHWIILKVQEHVPKNELCNKKHFDYMYNLYHRHEDAEGFHYQSEFVNLLDLILEIINHDDYRLKRRGRTYFDELVETYTFV